ncbi:MAG TPA: hypothetical protein VMY43_12225 [Methanothrix sp.]|nr:hypothetical protein [Methanothrix sp.]
MPISGDAFLEFADWLKEQESCGGEIKSRSIANRAYYGAFHITKNTLSMDDRANHRDVINELKNRSEYLGGRLYDFFEKRKEADYRINYHFKPGRADRMVSEIIEFLQDLKTEV